MKSRNVTLNCGTVEGSVRAARSGRRFAGTALMLLALGMSALLTGCSANFDPQLTGQDPSLSVGSFTGKIHGGQAPIYNASIFVFDTGHAGYPGASVAANVSTITSSSGTFSGIVNGTYYGNYVLTNQQGLFTISGFTCTPGDGVYLVSVGGQPIYGTTNASATEMAAMGICPAGGASALATSVPFVNINEVSTAAMAYALGGFTAAGYDFSHISTSATNSVGMATAFANAAILYSVATNNGANSISPVDPTHIKLSAARLNSVANILANCVNSGGTTSSSSGCYILFQNATSNGTYGSGTVPQDTASAMINITHNVQSNISNLYALASNSYAPYSPTLSATPPDLALEISYTVSGIFSFNNIAIDSLGSAYVTSDIGVVGVTKISPASGVVGTQGLAGDSVPAIDQSNNVFFLNVASLGTTTSNAITGYASSTTSVLGSSITLPAFTGLATGVYDSHGHDLFIGPTNDLVISGGTANAAKVFRIPYSAGTYATAAVNSGSSLVSVSDMPSVYENAAGQIWVEDYVSSSSTANGLYELSTPSLPVIASKTIASSSMEYVGGGIQGGVWSVDQTNKILYGYNNGVLTTTALSSTSQPNNPELDGLNSVWLPNAYNGACNVGRYLNGVSQYTTGITDQVCASTSSNAGEAALAIDPSGNVWVAGYGGGTANAWIGEFLGVAAPTVTPLSLLSTKETPSNNGTDIRP